MIRSMTGHGLAQHTEEGVVYLVELKSVNHRYLKLSVKLSEPLQYAENAIEKLLRSRIARGSVTCALRIQSEGGLNPATLDVAAMQRYVDQMVQVRLPPGIQAGLDLGAIATLPGVCRLPELDEDAREKQQQVVLKLTSLALDSLGAMRKEEGQALLRDLLQSCEGIRTRLAQVASRGPTVVNEYHERLKSRVQTLIQTSKLELESEGLMREVAIYADRCDISEELTRLGSHLDQFVEICGRNEQAGRALDFLTQELLREANTIAAKSGDTVIARNIVEVKRLIDRLKEQVQNVE